jgi:hypothetical protein
VAWYQNLGAGAFELPRIIAYEDEVRSISAADLDGDGDPDVLFGSRAIFGEPQAAWLENLGLGVFGPERTFPTPAAMTEASVHPADIDGDGDQDVFAIALGPVPADLLWFENRGDDCNGNGSPDRCEPDCDADGLIDACALASGAAVDCNANAIPDSCDTGCTAGCDADGDLCEDALDGAPLDPATCADADGDGCDDCASGTFDPGSDGADADADGFCVVGDCNDQDGAVWADPAALDSLRIAQASGTTVLSWLPPVETGAIAVRYDTLRSDLPGDFFDAAVCLESDDGDVLTEDGVLPAVGSIFHYLIRAENDCPGGTGAMGTDSAGVPRSGRSCP